MESSVGYSGRRTKEVDLWADQHHRLEWDKTEMKLRLCITEDSGPLKGITLQVFF